MLKSYMKKVMGLFDLKGPLKLSGDKSRQAEELIINSNNGLNEQILLGGTGTGKTFTIANIIKKMVKKTLVLAHNKTLAGHYGD